MLHFNEDLKLIEKILTAYNERIIALENENKALKESQEAAEQNYKELVTKYVKLKEKIMEKQQSQRHKKVKIGEIPEYKNEIENMTFYKAPALKEERQNSGANTIIIDEAEKFETEEPSVLEEVKRKLGIDKNNENDVKFHETVRKKSDRAKMHAADCPCCTGYYKVMHDIPRPKEMISRHKTLFPKKNTPAGFWDIGGFNTSSPSSQK